MTRPRSECASLAPRQSYRHHGAPGLHPTSSPNLSRRAHNTKHRCLIQRESLAMAHSVSHSISYWPAHFVAQATCSKHSTAIEGKLWRSRGHRRLVRSHRVSTRWWRRLGVLKMWFSSLTTSWLLTQDRGSYRTSSWSTARAALKASCSLLRSKSSRFLWLTSDTLPNRCSMAYSRCIARVFHTEI